MKENTVKIENEWNNEKEFEFKIICLLGYLFLLLILFAIGFIIGNSTVASISDKDIKVSYSFCQNDNTYLDVSESKNGKVVIIKKEKETMENKSYRFIWTDENVIIQEIKNSKDNEHKKEVKTLSY